MVVDTTQARRDISIDSMRGLAVILMVAGHVVGSTGDAGMRVPDESAWRWFYLMLEDIRMPLFTVLSGYVYAMRPLRNMSGYGNMLKGKARRLLVPLLVVGTIFYLTQSFLPGTNHAPPAHEIWRVYIFGYGHFWFLLALFLIFMLTPALDAAGALQTLPRWSAVLSASILAFIFIPQPVGPDPLAVFGALRLLPFFILGYGLNLHREALRQNGLLILAILFAGIALYLKVGLVGQHLEESTIGSRTIAVGVGISVLFSVLWIKNLFQIPWLAWLGQCSFGIYLLHVFGSAAARMVLGRFGWDNPGVVFVVSLIAGVLIPVAFELLFGRYRPVSWGVLGQKPQKREPAVVTG